jgi:hypothetical protein
VPRVYGAGHFTEDPYSQIVSPHGIPVDDLVSVLQKEIRRGRIDNAVLAAYEMFITSPRACSPVRPRTASVPSTPTGSPRKSLSGKRWSRSRTTPTACTHAPARSWAAV